MIPDSLGRRIVRRLDIELRCPSQPSRRCYRTCEIYPEGIYVEGISALPANTEVEIVLTGPVGEPLRLRCLAERSTDDDKRHLRFLELSGEQRTRLENILWPPWDGADLLDGLIIVAGRFGATSLEECLHLTNIVSNCRAKVRHRH